VDDDKLGFIAGMELVGWTRLSERKCCMNEPGDLCIDVRREREGWAPRPRALVPGLDPKGKNHVGDR
jgi:hypothetical protein